MKLRPYQEKALQSIVDEYRKGHKHILVCSPTGSGKGVMLSALIKRAKSKGSEVLFLVHRREIVDQVSAHLEKMLVKNGVIMAGEIHDVRQSVSVATIQTIARRIKHRDYPKADLIIVDECHHACSNDYQKAISYFKKNLVVGFTATPCRLTGNGLGTFFDTLINVATIQELTDQKYLVPVKYFAPSEPDLKGVKIKAGDYEEKQLAERMMGGNLVGDIVTHWSRLGENRQTMCFTTTVAHSIAVCKAFNDVGIPAEHIDGKTDKDKRNAILDKFRAKEIRVLCNCAVFTEGVDIPDISCVICAKPTKSLSLYMQMVGRGMRIADGKQNMLLIDHSGVCYEHGPVHEITHWTLDTEVRNVNEKNEQRKKEEKRPLTCPKCQRVYTGQLKCPECGNIPDIKQFGKEVAWIDGDLGEVCFKTRTVKNEPFFDKEKFYYELCGYAKEKNFASGWAAHQFKAKCGSFPDYPKGYDLPPSPETQRWIKGQIIRKSYQDRARRKHG